MPKFDYSIFRANPFTKGTDLICRLPSLALIYQPEASNLGDLLRFGVRMNTCKTQLWLFIVHSSCIGYQPCGRYFATMSSSSPNKSIQRSRSVKEQRKRSPRTALANQNLFCCHSHVFSTGICTFFPFRIEVKPLFEDRTFSLGPTNPSSNPVHLEPLSTLVIKVLI